jgi:peptidase E
VSEPQIVAIGGGVLVPETGNVALERYILDACGKEKPRVCFVPTASGEDALYIGRFYEAYGRFGASLDVLRFFRRTPADLRDYLFAFDVVHVGGGNTRSMLAVWRHWGFDAVLREAWERGIVLCGSSAGSICWFDWGLTDSVAGDLTAMECLGFLAGSNCPHYDGEKERRPTYERLVGSGELVPGIACDDGAGLHYRGRTLERAIASRPGARAYRVERGPAGAVETPLEPMMLR